MTGKFLTPDIGAMIDTLADFPEPPAGMKLRVLRSPTGVLLSGYRTISSVSHYIEKTFCLFLMAPFAFALGVGILFGLRGIVFFHEPIENGNTGTFLPQWAALSFVVPILALGMLFGFGMAGHILIYAIRLTPDRPNWELKISPNKWHITLYSKYATSDEYDNAAQGQDLDPSHIQTIGVGMIGEVYAEEVTDSQSKANGKENDVSGRVDLTKGLPPDEALWVQQTLSRLLDIAPNAAKPFE